MHNFKKLTLLIYILVLLIIGVLTSTTHHIDQPTHSIKVDSVAIKTPTLIDTLETIMMGLENSNDTNTTNIRKLADAIIKYGNQYDINIYILISIAYTESRINKYARSGVGPSCVGIFQLNERAHRLDENLKYDEYYQTDKACQIYSYYRQIYGNNINKILNGYNGNASLNNPYANKVMRIYRSITDKEI